VNGGFRKVTPASRSTDNIIAELTADIDNQLIGEYAEGEVGSTYDEVVGHMRADSDFRREVLSAVHRSDYYKQGIIA
jgi:hypothetical protein